MTTPLRYLSTRDASPHPLLLGFEEVLLAGLAPDGGLYVPERFPRFTAEEVRGWAALSYPELTVRVMTPFVAPAVSEDELRRLAAETYAAFDHPAVAPLKQVGPRLWLMELFHGPTLAFKDYALQLVGRLFNLVLDRARRRVTIVGATSGDTGSAAIEACRDRDAVDVFILFPHGRTSEVQRRQMTTVDAANVHAIAIDGTFDDCQDLVKAMFADAELRDELQLSAVNSINWARIAAQVVYYAAAAVALGAPDRPLAFSVPTGNFGNVYAGWVARALGLPIARLVVGTNRNDILARFLAGGPMQVASVEPSLSPSMDIQVASNFERLLFEAGGRDGAALAAAMHSFRATGTLPIDAATGTRIRELFTGRRVDDEETLAVIARIAGSTGEVLDPHSAVAMAAAQTWLAGEGKGQGMPVVALACAHPAKFPDTVEKATGRRPALPPGLADLFSRRERVARLPNDLATVRRFVRDHARAARLAGSTA